MSPVTSGDFRGAAEPTLKVHSLVGAAFAFRVPAAAIDIGSLFHRLTLGTAVLFRRDARANRVCALIAFFCVHASLP
jgi:hypothetical protein